MRRPNVLLFQMGKVASTALQTALIHGGVNCFHCHTLNYDNEARRLSRIFASPPDRTLAGRELALLSKGTALNMMVRWYRANQVPSDRKLRVITLTRDPVTRLASHFLQRVGYDASALIEWHRQFSGGATGGSGDLADAAFEMFRQTALLVVESKPSIDSAAAAETAESLAMALPPPRHLVVETLRHALAPLNWFEQQFTPLFGVGLHTLAELRQNGLAHRDLGSIEILVVRFEDLDRHIGAIARHAGLPALEVPPRNVAADKPNAAPVLAAARAFLATELGMAFQSEMRRTRYALACGYDDEQGSERRTPPVLSSANSASPT